MNKIDPFVRCIKKSASVDLNIEFDHFQCCVWRNNKICDIVNIQLNAKKDSVIIEYNSDNKLASVKSLMLPYQDFVDKIKTFFPYEPQGPCSN